MLKKLLVFTLILGFGLVIAGLVMTDGDLTQIKAVLTYSEDYEQVTDSGEEVINAVDISLVDNDIRFYYSEDEGFSLDYYVSEKDNISHSINDGKLVLTSEYAKNRSWFQWRWHIKDPAKRKVNIYLPASFKGSMDIEITSGSLVLENFELSSLIMDFTSGNVDIKNTNVTSQIKSTMTSGDFSLINANADSLTVSMTSGEILIEDSKILNNTYLDGTSGRIKVRNSTFEDLRTDMLSGSIYLNKIVANNVNIDITSGKAEILIIGNPNDYRVDLDITSGDIHYRGTKVKSQVLNPNGTKTLKVNGTSGDIEVDFVNE